MSHFTCLVILPEDFILPERSNRAVQPPVDPDAFKSEYPLGSFFEDQKRHDEMAPPVHTSVNAILESILAPFDENMEVEEYDRECYCKGALAYAKRNRLQKALQERRPIVTVQDLREQFWALDEEDRSDALWEDMIAPIKARDARIWAKISDDLKNGFNPDCEECHGSGIYRSTYNPASKWDWWRIGGRWDGVILGADVMEARQTTRNLTSPMTINIGKTTPHNSKTCCLEMSWCLSPSH